MRTANLIYVHTQQVFLDYKMLELGRVLEDISIDFSSQAGSSDKWSPGEAVLFVITGAPHGTGSALPRWTALTAAVASRCTSLGPQKARASAISQPFSHLVAANVSQLSYHQVL